MFLPKSSDAIHKAWLYRLLTHLSDDNLLTQVLRFKGGTCAAMRGLLDRFSVDLDFDLIDEKLEVDVRIRLEKIFKLLGLLIKDKSSRVPQYILKYESRNRERNTLKLEVLFPAPKNNDYEPVRLVDIDRIFYCHTIETMFANKLVAVMDRYEKHRSIAGRDIYDIHYFFMQGYSYKKEIIIERRKDTLEHFFLQLIDFVKEQVNEKIINQDLNYLLDPASFGGIRKTLKSEVLMLLTDELKRL